MALGHDQSLYLLAFDHRSSFSKGLFHASGPLSPGIGARISDAKHLIFEAFQTALTRGAPRETCAVLVDEQFGTIVARDATRAGILLAMPVEKSGQQEFQFQYGDDFGRHIEEFNPDFSKVLVRYNPEGDRDLNRRQTRKLAQLADWLHERDRKFLFELLVPATPAQLDRCGGEQRRYDREVRPGLVIQTIRELQQGGVEPDIWKIEGLDTRADCMRVVDQARAGSGREEVACIVLGRGAKLERVLDWLTIAAEVPGFDGFAIGRTVWLSALQGFVNRTLSRDAAMHEIADRYLQLLHAYVSAALREESLRPDIATRGLDEASFSHTV